MKKSFIIFIMLFPMHIAHISAQYASVVNYITRISKDVPDNYPQSYWNYLHTNHKKVKTMSKAYKKKKESFINALSTLQGANDIRPYIESRSVNTYESYHLISQIEDITKIRQVFSNVKFYVVENDTPNAGMYPDGTCEINFYWLKSCDNIEELVGICCHEIAHYFLQHRLYENWETIKAANRNQTWAAIGMGAMIGAYSWSQMNTASAGVKPNQEQQQEMYNDYLNLGILTMDYGYWYAYNRQKFTYSRRNEIEADVIAFWFMEKNGMDPMNFIKVLRKLPPDTPYLSREQRKVADHPARDERVEILEDLYNRYHGKSLRYPVKVVSESE